MTTSVGQALPGFAAARAPSAKSATGEKSDDTSFGKMVRDDEKPAAPENPQATEAGAHGPRWAKRALAGLGKAEPAPTESGKAASPKLPAAKAAKDDPNSDKASADSDESGQGAIATPLQDHLPLLMALHDMRHFSTSAKTDARIATADERAPDPALGGQPRPAEQLSAPTKKFRAASGVDTDALAALSRSEGALVAAGLSGQKERQQTDRIGPASDEPSHQDDLAPLLKDQPAADISAPEAKRTAPVMKGLEAIQSALRSDTGKQDASGGRIEIVAEQSFPAPAQNPISQTASALVDAIASDGLRQALSTPSTTSQMTSSVAVPTHVLKIELHPAELGVVTASMRLAGEQLSIELKPETHEAYRRLTTDSEAIVKSLRGLGFDVDKVTILQPSIAVPAATRTDASSALPMSSGRDQPSFQPGNSSGNNAGSGGQQPGRNNSNDAHEFGRAASPARERAGDDMFI